MLNDTFQLWCFSLNYCLVKNLASKTQWDKTIAKGKRVQHVLSLLILLDRLCCLIKNLTKKTQWDKNLVKGKRVQLVMLPLNSVKHLLIFKAWSCLIIARSCLLICSSFCRLCVEKDFDEICSIQSPLMQLFLIWAMQEALSLYIIVGALFLEEILQDPWTCCITFIFGCSCERLCLVKTLLEKTRWDKNLMKEKEYISLLIRLEILPH